MTNSSPKNGKVFAIGKIKNGMTEIRSDGILYQILNKEDKTISRHSLPNKGWSLWKIRTKK